MEATPEAAKVFRLSEEYTWFPPVRRGSLNRNIWSEDVDEVELAPFTHGRRRSKSSSHSLHGEDISLQRAIGPTPQDQLSDIGEEGRSSLDELIDGEVINTPFNVTDIRRN